eukprot:15332872-Ditylum_brightwellii.AAC.1
MEDYKWMDADEEGLIQSEIDDPEAVQIQWDVHNDWSQTENQHTDQFLNHSATNQYNGIINNATNTYQRRQVVRNELNQNPKLHSSSRGIFNKWW